MISPEPNNSAPITLDATIRQAENLALCRPRIRKEAPSLHRADHQGSSRSKTEFNTPVETFLSENTKLVLE
jgi:hypothetical protein